MRVNLLIFLLFLTISIYGQTKHLHDNDGNQIFFFYGRYSIIF